MKTAVCPETPLFPAPSGGVFFCSAGKTRTASSVWGARKRNQNLPGMGGVFNLVNLHVYYYAGNNPVKYIDPDGRKSANKMTADAIEKLGKGPPKITRKNTVVAIYTVTSLDDDSSRRHIDFNNDGYIDGIER